MHSQRRRDMFLHWKRSLKTTRKNSNVLSYHLYKVIHWRLFCILNHQTQMCKFCDSMFAMCLTRKLFFATHIVCILTPYAYWVFYNENFVNFLISPSFWSAALIAGGALIRGKCLLHSAHPKMRRLLQDGVYLRPCAY